MKKNWIKSVSIALIIFCLYSCKSRRIQRKLIGSTYELVSSERRIYVKDSIPLIYTNQFHHLEMSFLEDGPVKENFMFSYVTKSHYGHKQYGSLLERMIEHLNSADDDKHSIESGDLVFHVFHWVGRRGQHPYLGLGEAGAGRMYMNSSDGYETVDFIHTSSGLVKTDSIVDVFTMKKVF